jgi:hypothetical protein
MILVDSIVALTTIGLRHRRLRGEVRKLLARRRNPMFTPDGGNPRLPEMLSWYEQVLEKDDAARLAHRMLGAAMFLQGRDHPPPEDPSFADKLMEVPEDIALGMPALLDTRLLREYEPQVMLPVLLPWVAGADIEDLYLPAATLAGMSFSFSPDFVLDQLDDYATYMRRFDPMRRAATPSRNEPCSCGSGKKYKRCCGAAV